MRQWLGLPVALKIDSPDIAPKTETGGVRLNLANSLRVNDDYEEIIAGVKSLKRDARIDGVLVQQMTAGGIELMLGIAPDPIFGPVLVAGLGGIHVEVLRDVAYRIPPIDAAEALAMLRELRGFALLKGARGQAPRDIAALADCIVRLSWLAHDLRD